MEDSTTNILIARLRNFFPQQRPQLSPSAAPRSADGSDDEDDEDGFFHPNPIDVVVVRIMLSRSMKLPPDLVDMIFDHAEFWACSTSKLVSRHGLHIRGSTADSEDQFLLRSYPVGLADVEGKPPAFDQPAFSTEQVPPRPRGADCDSDYLAKLAKYPTPRLVSPARKVVFTIKSHDQGWGGEGPGGTYEGSWTWFEAGLERFDAEKTSQKASPGPPLPAFALRPIQPSIEKTSSGDGADEDEYRYVHPLAAQPKWEIQRNKKALGSWQTHTVTWSYLDSASPDSDEGESLNEQGRGRATGDGTFVRNLRMGDVVTVWGKARFPGWTNHVQRVKIDVYWAV